MVPLANMFGYVNTLRSMSQGRAQFTMQFDHYEQVPQAGGGRGSGEVRLIIERQFNANTTGYGDFRWRKEKFERTKPHVQHRHDRSR